VSVATEHEAVLEPLRDLAKQGVATELLPVRPHGDPAAGLLELDALREALPDAALVSVMLANNEIGVIQPIRQIAELCHNAGALLHCDATQAVGQLRVSVAELGVDLMSFTAHKLHGPKGVGALYVRRRDPIVRLDPQIVGGGQERGRRSGTLNTPGIVGFAKAIELCAAARPAEPERLTRLRDEIWGGLRTRIDGVQLVGPALDATHDGAPLRLGNNLCFALPGVDG
ncbi:MAG: aminotransferase class V-fold PLP-dependent enzyme, partial [Actinomycetota bacterium]